MKYLMLPYFVGCIYEGGTTEYVRVKTNDKDEFIINLLCKLDTFLPIMNDTGKFLWPTLTIEGIEVPYEQFFSYYEESKKWSYYEPDVEEYPGEDYYVVELRRYGYSHYYFLKASSKEELQSLFENTYEGFASNTLKVDLEISGEKFDCSDLVHTDVIYDKKGRVSGYTSYSNFENVYTREEWFNAENF